MESIRDDCKCVFDLFFEIQNILFFSMTALFLNLVRNYEFLFPAVINTFQTKT